MSVDRAKAAYDDAVEEREGLMSEQIRLTERLNELQSKKIDALAELRQKHQKEEAQLSHELDRDIEKQQGELNKLASQLRMAKQKVDSRQRDLDIAQKNEQELREEQTESRSKTRRF